MSSHVCAFYSTISRPCCYFPLNLWAPTVYYTNFISVWMANVYMLICLHKPTHTHTYNNQIWFSLFHLHAEHAYAAHSDTILANGPAKQNGERLFVYHPFWINSQCKIETIRLWSGHSRPIPQWPEVSPHFLRLGAVKRVMNKGFASMKYGQRWHWFNFDYHSYGMGGWHILLLLFLNWWDHKSLDVIKLENSKCGICLNVFLGNLLWTLVVGRPPAIQYSPLYRRACIFAILGKRDPGPNATCTRSIQSKQHFYHHLKPHAVHHPTWKAQNSRIFVCVVSKNLAIYAP